MSTDRDEFSALQKQALLETNAAEVLRQWPAEFRGLPPHYECEFCHFISDQRRLFQIDHVFPCALGGASQRAISPGDLRSIRSGDLFQIARLGVNQQLLCTGCNQAKKASEFVPRGAGYAFQHPELDRNPDHVYGGRPVG